MPQSLIWLSISNLCPAIDFSDVPIILLSSSPNLIHLDIDHYTSFTSEACHTLLLVPQKLGSLDITGALNSTVESLISTSNLHLMMMNHVGFIVFNP